MTLYKVLGVGRVSPVARVAWPRVGTWSRPFGGDLELCRSGWHLCTRAGLEEWVAVWRTVYEAEGDGPGPSDATKQTFRRSRLVRRVGVLRAPVLGLWAADCAAHVLPIFQAECPEDERPAQAIEAAWAYWESPTKSRSASGAAWVAAWAAAWAAERTASWAAARAAARAAAWEASAAAREASGAAAREAARAAARAAAWAAAGADASSVAWPAAREASWAASGAESEWQGEALLRRLGVGL